MTPSRNELAKLHRNLANIDFTRGRMETLFSAQIIKKTDVESVYEALFLRAVTSFEAFLEELFLSILEGKITYSRSRVQRKMSVTSRIALMEILLQGDKYMNWLPFHNVESRAKLYLKGGRPFSDLTNGDKSTIKTITTIRNAIAHKSPHALKEFRRTVIGSLSLLPGERTPAAFLRSRITSSPPKNRFEIYVGEMGRVAGDLC